MWRVKHFQMGSEELTKALKEGWEPFAVTSGNAAIHYITYERKQITKWIGGIQYTIGPSYVYSNVVLLVAVAPK